MHKAIPESFYLSDDQLDELDQSVSVRLVVYVCLNELDQSLSARLVVMCVSMSWIRV